MSRATFTHFASIYADHHRALWAYLVRLGAASTVADDICQEAFMRWLTDGRERASKVEIRGFLFTTATRLLTDAWRHGRRTVAWDDASIDPAVEPEVLLLSGGAWEGVTLRERQLLWLAYAEEFSHEEIAAITGLAARSIKVLLLRARARLKARLLSLEDPA